MKSCISTEEISDKEAVARAKEWQGIVGVDLVKEVDTQGAISVGSRRQTQLQLEDRARIGWPNALFG